MVSCLGEPGPLQMNGLIEGIAGNAIWSGFNAGMRKMFGGEIEITSPRPLETLSGAEPLGPGVCFPVRGKLKWLPKGHEIWLFKEDEITGLVWPQGFFRVQYNHRDQTWIGKISGGGRREVRIIAAVAPPTSQDFFRYFQAVGDIRNFQFEPLKRVPPECRNRASVQAYIP